MKRYLFSITTYVHVQCELRSFSHEQETLSASLRANATTRIIVIRKLRTRRDFRNVLSLSRAREHFPASTIFVSSYRAYRRYRRT